MAKPGKTSIASQKTPAQRVSNITSPDPFKKRINWDTSTKHTVILFLLSFFLYANTIHHGFVLDDTSVIQQNMLVRKGISGIPEILHTPYHYGYIAPIPGEKMNDLYRPLSLVLFATEFQINGDNPLMGHLANLLLYALCVVLLYRFLTRVFRDHDPLLPFIACLLFAVHPIHTEVVANIKSSDELLCFLFAFLSLSRLLSYIDTGKILSLVLAVFFFFLALLSKETAITLLGIYPFIYLFYRSSDKRKSFIAYSLLVLTAVSYLFIRVSVLKHYHSFNPAAIKFIDNQLIASPGLLSRYATPIKVLGRYLKLLFIPYPLICDYSYSAVPFSGFTDVWVILSLLVYGTLVVWTVLRLCRKKFDAITLGLLFYLVTLSVFSNLFLLIGSIMSERFLFFPSAGFCIVISALMINLLNRKNESSAGSPKLFPGIKLSLPLLVICLVFGVLTLQRNEEWKDNVTLYEADCAKSPQNYRLLLYLSGIKVNDANNNNYSPQERMEKYREVTGLLKKSISVYPESSESLAALGDAYLDMNEFDSAIYYGRSAMKYTSYSALAVEAVAVGCIQTGRQDEARQVLRYAMSVASDNPEIPGNMGSSFMVTKQYDSAIHYLRISYSIAPGLLQTDMLLSQAFKAIGENDSSLKYERQAHRN